VLDAEVPRQRYQILAKLNFSSPYVDLPARLTVRQNLNVYARLYGVPKVRERLRELASELRLEDFLDRPTGRLSAGQKTRVMLAKALVNRPRLLILDEPTASLDPDNADRLRSYLDRYAADSGATLFLASHNMAEVERLCDEVLLLKEGRLAARGAPAELVGRFGRRNLEEVFLQIAREGTDPDG